jgi:hypothetical protein
VTDIFNLLFGKVSFDPYCYAECKAGGIGKLRLKSYTLSLFPCKTCESHKKDIRKFINSVDDYAVDISGDMRTAKG